MICHHFATIGHILLDVSHSSIFVLWSSRGRLMTSYEHRDAMTVLGMRQFITDKLEV